MCYVQTRSKNTEEHTHTRELMWLSNGVGEGGRECTKSKAEPIYVTCVPWVEHTRPIPHFSLLFPMRKCISL